MREVLLLLIQLPVEAREFDEARVFRQELEFERRHCWLYSGRRPAPDGSWHACHSTTCRRVTIILIAPRNASRGYGWWELRAMTDSQQAYRNTILRYACSFIGEELS